MLAGECLVINKKPKNETNAGREILKKANRNQSQMTGGVTEPDQRDCGYDPTGRQDYGKGDVRRAKGQRAAIGEENEINQGQRQEKKRFQKQPGNGSGAGLLPQQSVEAETGAKP